MAGIEQAIRTVLTESGPEFEDFSFERPSAGHQGEVYLVTLVYDGEEYEVVVKFDAEGDLDQFALEPYLHEYVANRMDIPVPRILVFRESPDSGLPPYFVTDRVEGTNLGEALGTLDASFRERVVEHVGRLLGNMHTEIGFEGYGQLALDGNENRLVVDSLSWDWVEVFRDKAMAHVESLGGGPFDDLQSMARSRLEESLAVLDPDGVPRLVHDDFRPANMLVEPGSDRPISAVLDWQLALAGHPEYHLARTDFLFIGPTYENADTRERLRRLLYDGYREYSTFDPDDGYANRRNVYHFATLLWRMANFESAFDSVSELARARAKARYRQQFDYLASDLPE